MKKLKLFSLLSLGILSAFGILFGSLHNSGNSILYAEPEQAEPADPVEETYECKVVLGEAKHGTLKADKLEGHTGDLVTLNADADLFYLVKSLSVNGTALVEDEEIRGKFVFSLVEGENKVSVTFAIDKELFGEMSGMVEQIYNGDWANLFSLRNLIIIISFLLNGGLLFAMIRYYIKDKKLAKRVEDATKTTVQKVLPDATKEIILKALEELLAPYFAQISLDNEQTQEAMVVLCRCFALAQEDTPEARIAITKELSSLKLSDKASINQIEERIKAFIKESGDKMVEVLAKLDKMNEFNKEIIAKAEKTEKIENIEKAEKEEKPELKLEEKPDFDNGTQIE